MNSIYQNYMNLYAEYFSQLQNYMNPQNINNFMNNPMNSLGNNMYNFGGNYNMMNMMNMMNNNTMNMMNNNTMNMMFNNNMNMKMGMMNNNSMNMLNNNKMNMMNNNINMMNNNNMNKMNNNNMNMMNNNNMNMMNNNNMNMMNNNNMNMMNNNNMNMINPKTNMINNMGIMNNNMNNNNINSNVMNNMNMFNNNINMLNNNNNLSNSVDNIKMMNNNINNNMNGMMNNMNMNFNNKLKPNDNIINNLNKGNSCHLENNWNNPLNNNNFSNQNNMIQNQMPNIPNFNNNMNNFNNNLTPMGVPQLSNIGMNNNMNGLNNNNEISMKFTFMGAQVYFVKAKFNEKISDVIQRFKISQCPEDLKNQLKTPIHAGTKINIEKTISELGIKNGDIILFINDNKDDDRELTPEERQKVEELLIKLEKLFLLFAILGEQKENPIKEHNHKLVLCLTIFDWKCNICNKNYNKTSPKFYCSLCDFNMCCECYTSKNYPKIMGLPPGVVPSNSSVNQKYYETDYHDHKLVYCRSSRTEGRLNTWDCDNCREKHNNEIWSFYCTKCDFDLCCSCMGYT